MARTIARDHEEKRLAILETAAKFFAENGFDRSSMNQLAAACGVSKALIYHYYDSKDALLFDIVHSHLDELLRVVEAVDLSDADPHVSLRKLCAAILDAYRNADARHQVQQVAMAALPEDQRSRLAAMQRRIVAIVSDVLGATRPDCFAANPERLTPVTMSLFGMLNWFYMWHRPDRGLSRTDYAHLAADLILGGVEGL
ncbi:MAG: TetR/AcrR family transcriptional regulator [Rhodobacteraceae bacterium]|nr:TetR/AcrR family transcriptional regulator [Paracoccaceae bacterium]